MAEQCFKKKGSNPPVCGAHNVPLVRERVPDDMIAAGFKAFTYLACPRSGQLLNDEAENS